MKRILVVAAAALALAGCDAAVLSGSDGNDDTLDIPEIADGDISEKTMVDVTRELSSDEFEGRMPGSEGEKKTVELLTQRFEAAGLQPGNDGKWTQDVPLVEITGSDFAPLSITGGKDGGMAFEYGKDWVGVSYRETPRTRINNSELVFVGYGINAPERGWNDYEGLDMKGKTAVILVNDPDFGAEDLEGPFNGKAMTYYGRWTYKFEEAARQGAAGALIIHETEPASYGWNVVESSWSGPQAYPQRGENAPALTEMNGWIQNDVAQKIFTAAGKNLAKLKEAARKKDFKAVPLDVQASTSFANETREYMSQNVIGILPGTKRPDEYVLYTAHWDHLGRCTPADDGDDICNGAVDNATGTAALVALAEAQAKAGAADRSMVFLAVTAEEQGLLGSTYYAQNPVFPLDQTVGGVNMDAFLIAGPARDVTVVGPGKSQLDEFLAAALKADGRVATDNPTPEAGFYYRSDHFPFAKQGVPMLYLDGGEDLVDGGREAGEAVAKEYRDNRYHGPKDEFDENWDWSGVMADLQLYYRLGRMMAMSTSWPNWVEGDEFRGIRDESCAATNAGC
ncbi:peptidase M28 [Citromicrobium sp. RCC1885]|uniref:M28 family metallopeptidase n=1 Tax=unclassified Citromicrobium TaxID=2630544 RepID=UPI0006C91CB7|nr:MULTISPECIES: M28 family metallopeptidase [unclassified Citromicrobium]KPM24463.1 peptidase M28 [Citromicrobium sp. RCC1885]KPM27705.1 peptidase M28 [Citromicrobium sp. RCC1878]OAM10801.1 peptidase M28 [Citromicrobium sp. RCC1897]|tara:strand:+ start:311 stop:2011 length:1701 start_codon:yes stop_codon:yes gene_type:complete